AYLDVRQVDIQHHVPLQNPVGFHAGRPPRMGRIVGVLKPEAMQYRRAEAAREAGFADGVGGFGDDIAVTQTGADARIGGLPARFEGAYARAHVGAGIADHGGTAEIAVILTIAAERVE